MTTTAQQWRMRGEYFENCNCEVVCPCITSNLQAMPDEGKCSAILAFNIQEGRYGDVPLDGLSFIMALETPGAMIEGNAKLALYLDKNANDQQGKALETILGGQAGGMPAMLPDMIPITEMLGIKYVPITFSVDGARRRLEVPGVMEMGVEGVEGLPGKVMQITNAHHPANSTLNVARSTRTTYKDHGFAWDNSGKNAHYAPFEWQGP